LSFDPESTVSANTSAPRQVGHGPAAANTVYFNRRFIEQRRHDNGGSCVEMWDEIFDEKNDKIS